MSESSTEPWSTSPNAPKIPYWLYLAEKENFAGNLLGAIAYGITIVIFFHCMRALFNPINRAREGIRWGLVGFSAAMFSILTVFISMNLHIQSISYIDNREFPGSIAAPPGPLGYQFYLYSQALSIIPNFCFLLNSWLADGLLLYRCYVIYHKNIWAIVVPCMMYIVCIAMGIATDYTLAQPDSTALYSNVIYRYGLVYFFTTFALNVLLTAMIVVRLHLHNRMLRSASESATLTSRTHMTVVTMLIESYALYAATLLVYIIPWVTRAYAEYIFLPLLANVQVIAPYLILIRVANRRAFLSNAVTSGNAGSFNLRNRRELGNGTSGTLPVGSPESSMHRDGKTPNELAVGVVTTVDFHSDEV